MGTCLTLPVYTRALGLLHVRRFAQTAIRLHRENGYVASRVIRNQSKSACTIHMNVTGVGAQRWLLIQQAEVACPLIDRKGADGSAFSASKVVSFIYRI